MKNLLRKLAQDLLDDPHGINESGYTALLEVLDDEDRTVLNAAVNCQDDRFYIHEGIQLWE